MEDKKNETIFGPAQGKRWRDWWGLTTIAIIYANVLSTSHHPTLSLNLCLARFFHSFFFKVDLRSFSEFEPSFTSSVFEYSQAWIIWASQLAVTSERRSYSNVTASLPLKNLTKQCRHQNAAKLSFFRVSIGTDDKRFPNHFLDNRNIAFVAFMNSSSRNFQWKFRHLKDYWLFICRYKTKTKKIFSSLINWGWVVNSLRLLSQLVVVQPFRVEAF